MAVLDDSELPSPSRVLSLDGGINFRDLGGYRSRDGRHVKWGKLFRCGHLANLSDEDLVTLRALGINRVHDFRREEEQHRMPSRHFFAHSSADYQISIGSMSRFWDILLAGKLTALSSHELVVNSYRDCIEEVIPAYTRFMRGILDNDRGGSLFHCAAGKDRTGMAAALILGALDVPRETIVEDYLLTLEHFDSDNLLRLVEQHLRDLARRALVQVQPHPGKAQPELLHRGRQRRQAGAGEEGPGATGGGDGLVGRHDQ